MRSAIYAEFGRLIRLITIAAVAAIVTACSMPSAGAPTGRAQSAPYSVEVRWYGGGGGARPLISDPNVTAVAVEALNDSGLSLGTNNLVKQASYWSGSLSLSETGLITFKARAKASSGAELFFGQSQVSLSGSFTVISIGVNPLYGASSFAAVTGATDTHNWVASAVSQDGQTLIVVNPYKNYISTNGGSSWTEGSHGAGNNRDVAMSSDGAYIYLATSGDSSGPAIYRSTNKGVDWTRLTTPSTAGDYRSIACSADGSKVVAGDYGGNGYISYSTNHGDSWSTGASDSTRYFEDVACSSDGAKMVAVDLNGWIYVSADTGQTWNPYGATLSWMSVSMTADGSKMAAVTSGSGRIYLSPDSGQTWTLSAASPSQDWRSVAYAPDGTCITAVPYGGSLYTSTDGGSSWPVSTAAGSRYWVHVTYRSGTTTFFATANLAYVYESSDGGATYLAHTTMSPTRTWKSIASSSDGSRVVACANTVFASADFGATWTELGSLQPQNWAGVATSADGSRLAAVWNDGYSVGGIYTSSDYGASWSLVGSSKVWSCIASSTDGKNLAAGIGVNNGYIYTSTDYGSSWTPQTLSGSRQWAAIASSSDGSKLTAAQSGGSIYLSTNSGATWAVSTSPGSTNWDSLAMSADGTTIVGGANGAIYVSKDSGATWPVRTPSGAGFSCGHVACSADGCKIAACDYSQAYTSTDSGVTWTAREVRPGGSSSGYWNGAAMSGDGSSVYGVADGYNGVMRLY